MTSEQPDRPAPIEEQLDEILREAERAIAGLRAELADQRRQDAQHAEIDRMDEHLANARVHWGEVRGFFEAVIAQLRERRSSRGDHDA